MRLLWTMIKFFKEKKRLGGKKGGGGEGEWGIKGINRVKK